MPLNLLDVTNASYHTTRAADAQCAEILRRLGYKQRYLAARLAIARSLALPDVPDGWESGEEEAATPIRGQQLFGNGSDPAVWLALVTQRAGHPDLTHKDFQRLVAAHWRRGAALLTQDWEESGENLAFFVLRLADLANLPAGEPGDALVGGGPPAEVILTAPPVLPIGPVAEDAQTGEPVAFDLNAPGGSPHIAIMGGTNSGKTYTAVTLLRRLRTYGPLPILAFDFKGDLSERLAPDIGAQVVSPPRVPVPLDVLAVQTSDEIGLREAAGRIRESIGRVKSSKLSGVQGDALREAAFRTLRARSDARPATLVDVAQALEAEYQSRNRSPDELTATLNEATQFTLFEPRMSPAEFFGRSWIIRLPQDGTAEVRRLVINMTLDALDRWLNSQEDAPTVAGRRALRHLCLLDEAHVILATKLPALSNLIRMSRSKGGAMMLVSQSPDDFEGEEEGFLDNMGLTLAFTTQAKPGPTRRIFGASTPLADLPVGEALCRIRTEARNRRLLVWRP